MKTAVSLPDELFERAEELAARLGKSRSQVYREALAEYLFRREQRISALPADEQAAARATKRRSEDSDYEDAVVDARRG